jgi:hypothetical protein
MKTSSVKKRSWLFILLLALPLVCIAGIVFFFARMYQRDMQALTDFMTSYQAYDQAVEAASATVFAASGQNPSEAGAGELQADAALSDLKTRSSARISSLIKNEGEAMRVMQEIADLCDQEMSAFKAYRQASGQDANRDDLAQAFHDLTKQRQSAFAQFQELGR